MENVSVSNELKPLAKMSQVEVNQMRMLRWKARTDLGFLCRNILNYPDVSDEVHTPIFTILQKFPLPTTDQFVANDKVEAGKWIYTPIQRITSLPGGRRVLILDPRGWLKTTVNAQAHTIQWILNYPDIAIMIFQSNLEKAEMILGEIKRHFQYNPIFRQLFPEHCPTKSIDDFGTKGKFTTKARGRAVTRKEETVMTSSIDAGTAGTHVDVMKFSDIVEPSNTGTKEQMESIAKSFYMAEHLLVGNNYWIDMEGTRYDHSDLYGKIIESEKNIPEGDKRWKIHARGCYKKKLDHPQKFTPDELDAEDLRDEKGEYILHWEYPERGLSFKNYEAMRRVDPYIFSCQALNSPQGGIDGRAIFPVDKTYPALIRRADFTKNVRIAHWIATVDTAETVNTRSNYSCITIAGFASDGRVYVNEIIHGKFLPKELVDRICNLVKPVDALRVIRPFFYGPNLKSINIEETGFTRGLRVALDSYQHLNGIHLPIELIKKDNQVAKTERIQNSLQPFYTTGRLIFLDDIGPMEQLKTELKQFPRSQNDDILDTLADLFQKKEWLGREIPKLNPTQYRSQAMARMLGVEDPFDSADYLQNLDGSREYTQSDYYRRTGGL